jgi:hypothetical protein
MPVTIRDENEKVTIRILGVEYEVPRRESLLRGFQTLNAIRAFTEFCWNGDCVNCKVDYLTKKGEKRVGVLSCRVMAEEGLEITRVYSPFIKMPPPK